MKKYPGPLIRPGVSTSDRTYTSLRDRPELQGSRDLVEAYWSSYWPYADNEFYEDLPRDFFSRFWEMDLSCTFLHLGFALRERSSSGPDVCVVTDRGPIWVEAVAPRAGSGPNAAPDLDHDLIGHRFTDDDRGGVPGVGAVILRFRNAIEEKRKKYELYLNSGLVRQPEPYVVALNGLEVPGSIIDDDHVPTVLKAVYPLGPSDWRIDLAKGEVTDVGPSYRGAVKTAAGSEVSTAIFLGTQYSGISAVLYARRDVYNRPTRLGADFLLVHNREAAAKLDRGWLKAGVEFWPENQAIHRTAWEGSI